MAQETTAQETGDWLEEYEGQLALDAWQTDEAMVVVAPIAGVRPEDLEISITDEVVTIKGERVAPIELEKEAFLTQECYWGGFSRSYVLPVAVDAERAKARLKDGILTLTLPKLEQTKTRHITVETT